MERCWDACLIRMGTPEQGTSSNPEDQEAPHDVGPALGSQGGAPVSLVVPTPQV